MKSVLVTGFEPFGGMAENPSAGVARLLDGVEIRNHRVAGAVLACEFGKSGRQLRALIARHQPALVVCLGLAAGRTGITPERVALNLDDPRIPDNAGKQPLDRPVVRGGPAGYWSTLPVKRITAALEEAGIPAAVSHTAGTFVCNHVFYHLMHGLAGGTAVRGGFIHLPEWPVDVLARGVRIALEVSLAYRRDAKRPGGIVS